MQPTTWIDRDEYPFAPHTIELAAGRIHYVDEGQGQPIVMVHGTPTWSFLYRNLIKGLSSSYRCIAIDNLGFGLSDKPTTADYRPQALARNLTEVIERLGLGKIVLVVHDFGGPIGLSYAVDHPEQIKRLVLFNTWMWSMRGEKDAEQASRIFAGSLGKLLYTRMNISPRLLFKLAWGDKSSFRSNIQQQYIRAVPTPHDRLAMWAFVGEVLGSSAWYDQLWQRRDRVKDIPALLLWGMRDPAFKPNALERWQGLFSDVQTVAFPSAGHFVQEEQPDAVLDAIRRFLAAERTAEEAGDVVLAK